MSEIITNIKNFVEQDDAVAETIANAAYKTALNSLGRIASVPWNKEKVEITLTSGTADYALEDLYDELPQDIKGILSIWHTDKQNSPVSILPENEFNPFKRGSTTTGRPFICMIYDKSGRIEFYYTPDDNYTLWTMIRKTLLIEDIPDVYKEIVQWRGIMTCAPKHYEMANNEYMRILAELESESRDLWEGSRINPLWLIGESNDGRLSADSGNWWGMG